MSHLLCTVLHRILRRARRVYTRLTPNNTVVSRTYFIIRMGGFKHLHMGVVDNSYPTPRPSHFPKKINIHVVRVCIIV